VSGGDACVPLRCEQLEDPCGMFDDERGGTLYCTMCDECPHDECTIGGPLDARCSRCAATVCEGNEFCCTLGWDETCVALTTLVCLVPCSTVAPVGEGPP
jgi:hypothetical protein